MKYSTKLQAKRAMRAQQNAYQKRSLTAVMFRFHNENDADVLAKIQSQKNKADYIRKLVRADIIANGMGE